jgi:hypothetical protein
MATASGIFNGTVYSCSQDSYAKTSFQIYAILMRSYVIKVLPPDLQAAITEGFGQWQSHHTEQSAYYTTMNCGRAILALFTKAEGLKRIELFDERSKRLPAPLKSPHINELPESQLNSLPCSPHCEVLCGPMKSLFLSILAPWREQCNLYVLCTARILSAKDMFIYHGACPCHVG